MIAVVDRHALVRELIIAVREDPDLRSELCRALEIDAAGGMVSPATYAKRHELGVSTVRAAIREGRLPCTRIGRAVRISADAVIAPRAETLDAKAARKLGLVRGGVR